MSQFPVDHIIWQGDVAQSGNWYPDTLPQIWTRLALLEKQVFGIAQQPPYPVPVAKQEETPPS